MGEGGACEPRRIRAKAGAIMHDLKSLRADPAAFAAGLARRGIYDAADALLAADTARRAAETRAQDALARRNAASKDIGAAMAAKDNARAEALKAEVAGLKDEIATLEAAAREAGDKAEALLVSLPNLPAAEVPDGLDEHGNLELLRWGTPRAFDFQPLEHDFVAIRLGYDPEAAARVAGARFAVLKGPLARLQRALGQYMIDTQTSMGGYQEIYGPLLVKAEAAFGTGQLPKMEEDVFKTTDGRYLIPTAEMSLTNLVAGEIVEASALPIRMTALTPCFRSEAGSAGRDTRGLIRQHQFEKCELVTICTPEQAKAEHQHMLESSEAILQALNLPYRRMLLCAGDMGFSARLTFDLEVWLPGQGMYREIASISDCGEFQGRRMNARWKVAGEKGSRGPVNTLNGSGLAVGRTLVAVIENYQQADGSVIVPDVLQPYMAGVSKLEPR
jgi:seryl-tRNA synthetase